MVVHYTHDNHHHAKKNVSVYDDKNIWLYCIVETNNNYLSSINVSEKGTKFHSFNVCFYKSWNTCWILIFPSKAFLLVFCMYLAGMKMMMKKILIAFISFYDEFFVAGLCWIFDRIQELLLCRVVADKQGLCYQTGSLVLSRVDTARKGLCYQSGQFLLGRLVAAGRCQEG